MPLHAAICRLERFAEACGAPVVRSVLMTGLVGQVKEGRILLRKRLSLEQQLLTLVHELTHLLVHCHANPPIDRTVCEYEAEAVERWVGQALQSRLTPADDADTSVFTDDLLACSVSRVRYAARRLLDVARGAAAGDWPSLQPQPAVQIDASAREEVILNDELHGMRNFIGLAQSF